MQFGISNKSLPTDKCLLLLLESKITKHQISISIQSQLLICYLREKHHCLWIISELITKHSQMVKIVVFLLIVKLEQLLEINECWIPSSELKISICKYLIRQNIGRMLIKERKCNFFGKSKKSMIHELQRNQPLLIIARNILQWFVLLKCGHDTRFVILILRRNELCNQIFCFLIISFRELERRLVIAYLFSTEIALFDSYIKQLFEMLIFTSWRLRKTLQKNQKLWSKWKLLFLLWSESIKKLSSLDILMIKLIGIDKQELDFLSRILSIEFF